jgi:hypothetical protein
MASVLKIAGSTVARGTAASRIILNRYSWHLDEYDTLEFSEIAATLPGTYGEGTDVTLDMGGTRQFTGRIVSRHWKHSAGVGWTIGYRANGLKWSANIAVTNPNDLTGTIAFNLPVDDPNYSVSLAGQSVGQIITFLLDGHATALIAAGVGTVTGPYDGYLSADLTPLTAVPPEPVYISGPKLFTEIDRLLERWSGKYCCYIEPNGPVDGGSVIRGQVRVRDATAFATTTATLGDVSNPWELPEISVDTADNYTRVVVRGSGDIQPGYATSLLATLVPAWTGGQQAAWKWSDFADPAGAVDSGTITALGTTTVTVQSLSGSRTWASNFWSTNQGWIYCINDVATGITQTESRRITSNTSLSAGGTSVITLDRQLDTGGYIKYRLIAQPINTNIDVWRRYTFSNTYLAAHLAQRFPRSVPWSNATTVIQTNYPIGSVVAPAGGGSFEYPANFEIDQVNQDIRFYEPVVKGFNTQANLDTGGGSVVAPLDVKVLVPYSRGTLQAAAPADTTTSAPSAPAVATAASGGSITANTYYVVVTLTGGGHETTPSSQTSKTTTGSASTLTITSPASGGGATGYNIYVGTITGGPYRLQGSNTLGSPTTLTSYSVTGATPPNGNSLGTPNYSGTAFTVDGIQRTYYYDVPSWVYAGDQSQMAALAAMLLAPIQDRVIEGSIGYNGLFSTALTRGLSLSIAANYGSAVTTGWESLAACVRVVTIEWPQSGANQNFTTLSFSNRRKQATGADMYVHPMHAGVAAWDLPNPFNEFVNGEASYLGGQGLDAMSTIAGEISGDQGTPEAAMNTAFGGADQLMAGLDQDANDLMGGIDRGAGAVVGGANAGVVDLLTEAAAGADVIERGGTP